MKSTKEICLTALDHFLLLAIISPLVVAYWWGTWTLLDVYFYPNDIIMRSGITTLIGCIGMTSFYLFQDVYIRLNEKIKNFIGWFIFNNLYIIVAAFYNVCKWHGVWSFGLVAVEKAQTIYNRPLFWLGLILILATLGFMLTRTMKNAIAPPTVCLVDIDPEIYKCATRFKQRWRTNKVGFILDCCFTELVIHSFVPLFWMSSWTIWDIYLGQMTFLKNAVGCLVAGICLAIIVYLLQIPLGKLCRRLESNKGHWLWKTMVEQVFYFLGASASVATWRGWWMLYAEYIKFESSKVAGPWFGSAGGLFILMRIHSGSSVICKGALVDGEFEKGKGAILSTNYIRYFMARKQEGNGIEEVEEAPKQVQNEVPTEVPNEVPNQVQIENPTEVQIEVAKFLSKEYP